MDEVGVHWRLQLYEASSNLGIQCGRLLTVTESFYLLGCAQNDQLLEFDSGASRLYIVADGPNSGASRACGALGDQRPLLQHLGYGRQTD